jgi:hypothetical protein
VDYMIYVCYYFLFVFLALLFQPVLALLFPCSDIRSIAAVVWTSLFFCSYVCKLLLLLFILGILVTGVTLLSVSPRLILSRYGTGPFTILSVSLSYDHSLCCQE